MDALCNELSIQYNGMDCVLRKPIPHKVSPQHLSKCCNFKLNLHPLGYRQIHRGITVTYPQKWISSNHKTIFIDNKRASVLTFWKPYLRKFFSRLVPAVYAKDKEQLREETNNSEGNEEEVDDDSFKNEQFGLGEKPVEMLADEILRNETGWDRLKEMYGRYEV